MQNFSLETSVSAHCLKKVFLQRTYPGDNIAIVGIQEGSGNDKFRTHKEHDQKQQQHKALQANLSNHKENNSFFL